MMFIIQVLLFPALSNAVYMTRDKPSGNLPGLCDCLVVTGRRELSENSGSSHVTLTSVLRNTNGAGEMHRSTRGGCVSGNGYTYILVRVRDA